jgi:adenine phosphoribosyltransferase
MQRAALNWPDANFLKTRVVTMFELQQAISNVPDFPRPGILFRDISPLLRDHFDATVQALDGLLTEQEWSGIDALAGVESRGFILGAALALRRSKGFVLVRKQGKLPPPVVDVAYDLEYGSGVLEMQRGRGRLVLIDDVLATGGTMTAAANLCERAGYQLQALTVLIDLNIVKNYSWRGLNLRAVINY